MKITVFSKKISKHDGAVCGSMRGAAPRVNAQQS